MRRALRQHPVLTGLRRLGCPIVHPDFLKFLPRPEPEAMARNALAALGACVGGREGGCGEGVCVCVCICVCVCERERERERERESTHKRTNTHQGH